MLKVTIIPRGSAALGYAQYLPKDQYLYSTEQLADTMCMTLGGRCAEKVFFGKITTGATDDLRKVARMAYAQVTDFGMNDAIGPISFGGDNGNRDPYGISKPYSEETGQLIDEEVRKLVGKAYQRTLDLVTSKRNELETVAEELLKRETLTREDLIRLLGPRPFDEKHPFDELIQGTVEKQAGEASAK